MAAGSAGFPRSTPRPSRLTRGPEDVPLIRQTALSEIGLGIRTGGGEEPQRAPVAPVDLHQPPLPLNGNEYQLALEFLRRNAAGDGPSVEEFLAEHPEVDAARLEPILMEALTWPAEDATKTLRQRFEAGGEPDAESRPESASKEPASPEATAFTPWSGGNGKEFEHRYKRRQILGEGGYGKVFLVEDRMHGSELLALKVIRKVHTTGDLEQRFRNEIRVLRALSHPGIPMIFNDGKNNDGEIYYTMSYVQGRTLAEIIRKEAPLDPERILHLSLQILDILAYAHEKGIVHRDLKPSNMIIVDGPDGERVNILDFGIAKVLRHEGLLEQAQTMGTEVPLGTPHYMAPEQVRGHVEDGRTDLYALGIIIYQMCSGRLPFEGKTSMEVLIARLENSPRKLTSDEAPQWLRDLIGAFLKRDKDKRPTTRQALEAFQAVKDGTKRNHKRMVGAVVSVAALVLLGLGWVFFGGSEKSVTEAAGVDAPRGPTAAATGQLDSVEPEAQRPAKREIPRETGPPRVGQGEVVAGPGESIDKPIGGGSGAETEETGANAEDPVESGLDPSVGDEKSDVLGEEVVADQLLDPAEQVSGEDSEIVEASEEDLDAATLAEVDVPRVADNDRPEASTLPQGSNDELQQDEAIPDVVGSAAIAIEALSPDWLQGVVNGSRFYRNDGAMSISLRGWSGTRALGWWDHADRPGKAFLEPGDVSEIELQHEGEWTFRLYAVTDYDARRFERSLFEFVVVYDAQPPTGESLIDGLTGTGLLQDPLLRISGNTTDGAPGKLAKLTVSLRRVNGPWNAASIDIPLNADGSFDASPLLNGGDGKYEAEYVLTDQAENSTTWSATFELDTTPPHFVCAAAFWGESPPMHPDEVQPARVKTYEGEKTIPDSEIRLSTTEAVWTIAGEVVDLNGGELEFEGDGPVAGPLERAVDLRIGKNRFELLARDAVGNTSTYDLVIERNPLPLEELTLEVLDDERNRGIYPPLSPPLEGATASVVVPSSSPSGTDVATSIRVTIPGRPEFQLAANGPGIDVQDQGDGQFLCVVEQDTANASVVVQATDLEDNAITMCTVNIEVRRAELPDNFDPAGPAVDESFWFKRIFKRIADEGTGMEFVLVPSAGGPPAFYIGKHEVTRGQYREGAPKKQEGLDDLPVVDVSYAEALAFSRSLGGELPTEEQWLHAAKKGPDYNYPWGATWKTGACNSAERGDIHPGTAPVGSYPLDTSWCGALDMAGNVREFVFFNDTSGAAFGGSWDDPQDTCVAKMSGRTAASSQFTGFRVVVPAQK